MPSALASTGVIAATLASLALSSAAAQGVWQPLTSGSTASLRGLHVVNDRVIWASGTRGTVLRSIDGGATWNVDTIPGARAFDVRAVTARGERVAHAAATAGRIWRTTDGGETWSLRYQAADTSVFLDAIAFWDDRHGMALGDPLNGRFLILTTDDAGESWQEAAAEARPEVVDGEAAFAASGTSLVLLPGGQALIATGGAVSRLHRSLDRGETWSTVEVPVQSGSGSNGIFSIATASSLVIAVGGDYRAPDDAQAIAARSTDGGATWSPAKSMPSGYRSGVALGRRGLALTVGTNGSDISHDGGMTWSQLDHSSFNAVQISPSGTAFAVGQSGAIARLDTRRLISRR